MAIDSRKLVFENYSNDIAPLIFASIIRGLTSSGSLENLQKLGLGVLVYFVVTTTVALTIGILVVTAISPGNFIDSSLIKDSFGIDDLSLIEKPQINFHDLPHSIVGLVPSSPLLHLCQVRC